MKHSQHPCRHKDGARIQPRSQEVSLGSSVFLHSGDSRGRNLKCPSGQGVFTIARPALIAVGADPHRPSAHSLHGAIFHLHRAVSSLVPSLLRITGPKTMNRFYASQNYDPLGSFPGAFRRRSKIPSLFTGSGPAALSRESPPRLTSYSQPFSGFTTACCPSAAPHQPSRKPPSGTGPTQSRAPAPSCADRPPQYR